MLSCTGGGLGAALPLRSSDVRESADNLKPPKSCTGWGLHSPLRRRGGGSLLHCRSTLTAPNRRGGLFLLHFP